MLLIQDQNKKTLWLSTNSAFPNGEDPQWIFDNNIAPHHPELVNGLADCLVYSLNDGADASEVASIMTAGARRLITNQQTGEVTGCTVYPQIALTQTASMQLTMSNGAYANGVRLNLPIAARQVNIVADTVYDKDIEVAVVRNTSTGALDVLLAENGAAPPVGWTMVQSLLKFELPAGTTDLSTLEIL